jgi:hypothetical protein
MIIVYINYYYKNEILKIFLHNILKIKSNLSYF